MAVAIRDRLEDLAALVVVDMDKLMLVQRLRLERLTLVEAVVAAATQESLVCLARLAALAL